jgi:hypothetical protein
MDGLIVAMLLSSAEYARFGCGTENSEAVSLRSFFFAWESIGCRDELALLSTRKQKN